MRALVIDDSSAMRRLLGGMLADLGFEVTESEHGADALERLEAQGAPDLVLVDWNMPVMNGLDFVKAVRAQPKYDGMRLMMVTTETGAEEMTMALEAGADEYVMKPFTRDAITEKIRMLGL
ncbi:MAG: response regulator [Myxococcota bacterium]